MRRWVSPLLIVLFSTHFLSTFSLASDPRQESQRQLDSGSGDVTSKFLTQGEVDSWVLKAKANEVLIVHVTTSEFDSIVGLARENKDGDEDEVLFSIDEKGSNSHFYHRIQKAGTYKIRVHGYQMKGGGNYQMTVKRFVAKPAEIGKRITGKFNEHGYASFFFDAQPNQQLVLDGGSVQNIFDHKGQPVSLDWMSTLLVKTKGEHLVRVKGWENRKFDFHIRPASIKPLAINEPDTIEPARNSMNVWEFETQPGQFRVISVSRAGNPEVRLVAAPNVNKKDQPLLRRNSRVPIRFLPVASKGETTRFAVVFGVSGTFQLQTYSRSNSPVHVEMVDPTVEAQRSGTSEGELKLGGAKFYGFKASAGDVVTMNVQSKTFDSVLRLIDPKGEVLNFNDDFRDSRDSQITHLFKKSGYFRWQIGSLGDGGGGQFKIELTEIEKKKLEIGEAKSSKIKADTTQYWKLASDQSKSVFIQVRSNKGDAQIEVYDAAGRSVSSNRATFSQNSVVPIQLDRDDPLTIWVSSRNGGEYDIRVMDADW